MELVIKISNLKKTYPVARSMDGRTVLEAVKNGAYRQVMHEVLREISMEAWSLVSVGEENPLLDLMLKREEILKFVGKEKLEKIIDPQNHLGTLKERIDKLLN